MFGVHFSGKRDRRALFLVPFICWAPLRREFPAEGLTELRLDPWSMQVTAGFSALAG